MLQKKRKNNVRRLENAWKLEFYSKDRDDYGNIYLSQL